MRAPAFGHGHRQGRVTSMGESQAADQRIRRCAVSERALDVAAIAASVDDDHAGAVVTFSGVVRDHDRGRRVTAIEYEGHPSAPGVLARVAAQVLAEFPGVLVAIEHRSGMLRVGDVAMVGAVSASHRGQAFMACSRLVDLVKEQLPVWKRQIFADGTDEWTGTA